jgi:phage terminase Nu1 subunit (DNA packaging protein)
MLDLDDVISQKEFAGLVQISEPRVSLLKKQGIIEDGATGRRWLQAYLALLRDRRGTPGRAAAVERLALSRAAHQELKTARLRGEVVDVLEVRQTFARVAARSGRLLEAIGPRLTRELGVEPRVVELVVAVVNEVRTDVAPRELRRNRPRRCRRWR